MKRLKKLFKILGDMILIAVVLLLVVVTFLTVSARVEGRMGPSWIPIHVGRVVSGSMEPEIPVGSLVVAGRVDVHTLTVGDDIMFSSTDPSVPDGVPVTHRIIAVETDDQGRFCFTTKGIANDIADDYPVYEDQIFGKLVWVSEAAGTVVSWLQKPWIFPVLIGILFLDLVWNIVVVAKLYKNDTEENE